jgi:hypothetical protein
MSKMSEQNIKSLKALEAAFTPEPTLEIVLKKLHKCWGTYAFCVWAKKLGYKFEYIHKVILGVEPRKFHTYNSTSHHITAK